MDTSDIDIRKKEKKLDRSHWMCRIQKYTLGIDAPTFYMGYCPFFWMTWVCVTLSPFILFFKLCIKPVINWVDRVASNSRKRRYEARDLLMNTALQPSHSELIKLYECFGDNDSEYDSFNIFYTLETGHFNCRRYSKWFEENPNWIVDVLPAALEWRENELKKKLVSKKTATFIVKFRNIVSTCGATVFKGLIPAAILAASYGIYIGVMKLASTITLESFALAVAILSGLVAAGISIVVIADFIEIIVANRTLKKRKNQQSENSSSFIEPVFSFIGNAFAFVRDTVKMTYKQECPMIIWGDETGKIEKRKKTVEDLG